MCSQNSANGIQAESVQLALVLLRWDGVMWTGLVWLRIGSAGELL
jgi:hypothetical protein